MGKLNAAGMAAIETARVKRLEEFRALTSNPSNLNNPEQTKALKKYIDEFELSVNQMYLYQALSSGIVTWVASWLVARVIPIPEFVNYFSTAFLYFGAAGYILERFSTTDFYNQLSEMKQLYNWCLKNGSPNYEQHIDNTENLANPLVQRMIKLMAPLCPTEFMIVWNNEVEKVEENSGYMAAALSAGISLFSNPLSLFSQATQPDANLLHQIRELKVNVETRKMDLGTYGGFKHAIDYFLSNSEFRPMMLAKLSALKDMLPAPVMAMVSTAKLD